MSITITVTFDERILNDPQVCHGTTDRSHRAEAPGKFHRWPTCNQCGYQPVECNDTRTGELFIEAPHPKRQEQR